MSEPKITLQELRQMQRELAELKAERETSQERPAHQVISVGRLGRELFPGYFVREAMISATLKASKEDGAFGDTSKDVSVELDIPSGEYLFLYAVDFGLWKSTEEPNTGLCNTWLCKSGEGLLLYPHTTPDGETIWRYVGRDFEWSMGEASGKAGLQNGWRPSSDAAKHPLGYVLAEEMLLKSGSKFAIKARPLGSNNMWLPDGSQQKFTLNVYLRCYEMVQPLNPRGV
ncbi:MAG: hypothetical protein H6727_09355 [Myxococcales bacterium]|nr:hypothetical protein [Myxococcales bacterium]